MVLSEPSPTIHPMPNPQPVPIPLDRRVCTIRAHRIEVRPSRGSLLMPLSGFLAGVVCLLAIVLWLRALPFPLVVALLLVALLSLPLAGLSLVYLLLGVSVIVDGRKGWVVRQQAFLGLGVGTAEGVPFARIAGIVLEETTVAPGQCEAEDVAQWQVAVVGTDGRRLGAGTITVPRPLAAEGQERAREVAAAIARMTGAPVSLSAGEGAAARGKSRRRRGRRRAAAGV